MKTALEKGGFVLCAGGLGPTDDDVTREAASEAVGRKLVLHRPTLAYLQNFCRRRGRAFSDKIKRMAYVLEGAVVLENPLGMAPGQILEISPPSSDVPSVLALLPGPPEECRAMFEQQVLPWIQKNLRRAPMERKTLCLFGPPESEIETRLRKCCPGLAPNPTEEAFYSIRAKLNRTELILTCRSEDPLAARQRISNFVSRIRREFGEDLFSEEGERLEQALGRILTKQRRTLAVAESCTGGRIADRITAVPGSSLYFLEGLVTYSNRSKVRLLGVSEEALEKFGAVSEEVCRQMVRGIRERTGCDIALATTGICGPAAPGTDKPVGLAYIACKEEAGEDCREYRFTGTRDAIKERICAAALDLLRRRCLSAARHRK